MGALLIQDVLYYCGSNVNVLSGIFAPQHPARSAVRTIHGQEDIYNALRLAFRAKQYTGRSK